VLCDSLRVALNKTLTPARKTYLAEMNNAKRQELFEKMAELKHRINKTLAERKSAGIIKSDFALFSTESSKVSLRALHHFYGFSSVPTNLIFFSSSGCCKSVNKGWNDQVSGLGERKEPNKTSTYCLKC